MYNYFFIEHYNRSIVDKLPIFDQKYTGKYKGKILNRVVLNLPAKINGDLYIKMCVLIFFTKSSKKIGGNF